MNSAISVLVLKDNCHGKVVGDWQTMWEPWIINHTLPLSILSMNIDDLT